MSTRSVHIFASQSYYETRRNARSRMRKMQDLHVPRTRRFHVSRQRLYR